MLTMLMCSILLLLVVGWVLYVNANDRKTFEKELREYLEDRPEDRP
ncbi:hypothetical protein [Massilia consociata]|uniref:Uncharacterized protein n=1 Tax=Massilia consociata TaxID=760117 RepID=A0ABV6FFM2_9BURK